MTEPLVKFVPPNEVSSIANQGIQRANNDPIITDGSAYISIANGSITLNTATNVLVVAPTYTVTSAPMFLNGPVLVGQTILFSNPVHVANLPAADSSNKGTLRLVDDANAPTWNSTLVGGGLVFCFALSNGTNWTAR